MSTHSPILELQGVSRRFPTPQGEIEPLHPVDLSVSEGEFVIITGPSGSGKTTFLHLAALVDQPTTGRIIFDGDDASGLDEAGLCAVRKHKIGMVFQNYHLLPRRSVLENVAFRFRYLEFDRREGRRLARRAVESVGLSEMEARPVRLLSSGEMQRVAIARAVSLKPLLLAADEPTGNLDRESKENVMELLRRFHEEGITVLLVTHDESLLKFCTRHLICRDGWISQ